MLGATDKTRSGEISARQQAEGDLPLIDKAGLSESSTSKTPTAYQWGQIPKLRRAR